MTRYSLHRMPTCCCSAPDSDDDHACCPGYVHTDDGCPGVERCEACDLFSDDAEAQRAHDSVCDCGLTVESRAPLSVEDSQFLFG